MIDWAAVFVAVVTFAGVVAGAWLGEKFEDWRER
jgi:hypothetical protein